MFLFRIILMALRGLRTNLVRSLLATLGVIIGVGAVVSAVSILKGSERGILEQFESLGADQVLVFNGQGQRGGRMVAMNSLEPSDAEEVIRDAEDVIKATAPQYMGAGQIKYYQKNAFVNILGTNEAYASINNYKAQEGRFITREDVRASGMVAVLGYGVARDLFGALPAIGKNVKINGKSFSVIGVMEERGMIGFMQVDDQVVIPLPTAMRRMFGTKHLTSLIVQSADARRLQATIDRVKQSLRVAHKLKPHDENDFQVFTQEQIKKQLGQAALIFAVVFYSIAGISMVVGGIGIMNIMMVSVTERTREIGVRIAVGARRSDILWQFLLEAGIISLLGGGLGVVCGWGIGNLLSDITQAFEVYTPLASVVFALVVAIVVGIVSGIYPAVRAARLDPVMALRFE